MAEQTQAVKRWCVHIPGPDDLYPQESKEAAEALAKSHNAWAEANATVLWKSPWHPPREAFIAVVIPWPHGDVSDAEWARMVEDAKQP